MYQLLYKDASNAYRNLQLCYVANILTQFNIPCIWSGKNRTGI